MDGNDFITSLLSMFSKSKSEEEARKEANIRTLVKGGWSEDSARKIVYGDGNGRKD